MIKHKYRPDIDGLRAVAVLLVLFHHLFPNSITGGFIGVDIFFVISGFLITTQIFTELEAGKFSITEFYQRRINRIIPTLLVVSATSVIVGILTLSPADLILLSRSALSAMLGISNVFFWKEYGSYFSPNSTEAPLLHTWSLGVEEQYYVLWPLLLLGLFKFGKNHVMVLVGLLLLASLAISELGARIVASASYYLLPMRFFELLLGGIAALAVFYRQLQWLSRIKYSSLIGLILIIAAALKLDDSAIFPGIHAMVPCLGTALLLFVGTQKNPISDPVLNILTKKPLVALGLISYSLYLWHWPIIAWLNYKNVEVDSIVATIVIMLSLILSWITWRFVETPFRRSGILFSFSHVLGWRYVLPVLGLSTVVLLTINFNGFPERFDGAVARMEVALNAQPELLRRTCHSAPALYFMQPNPNECHLGATKLHLDGLLIGDSYANHFTGMVDVMAKADSISIMDYTMSSCPPLLGYKAPVNAEWCEKRTRITFDYIKNSKPSKVILAANWPNSEAAGEKLEDTIGYLLNAGASVTLIIDNAYIPKAGRCPIKKLMFKTDDDCSSNLVPPKEYLDEIKSKYPSINIINPNSIICQNGKCSPTYGDLLLYRDNGHLNDFGSRLVGEKLLAIGVRL